MAKVIHDFGRAELVDRDGLARLVSSISRFVTPEQATAGAHGAEVDIVDSRPLGGAWGRATITPFVCLSSAEVRSGVGTASPGRVAGTRIGGRFSVTSKTRSTIAP